MMGLGDLLFEYSISVIVSVIVIVNVIVFDVFCQGSSEPLSNGGVNDGAW